MAQIGSCVHDGTWKSAVYGLADQDNLRKLRKRIGCAPVPVVGAKLKRRGLVFYDQELKEYSVPFMGSDVSVVKRSQRYLHTELQETPVSYRYWYTWRRPLPTAAGGGGAGAPERPYELVVFGASGFTGQFVVEEVARAAGGGELRGALRWAVAGRRREKLQAVLERAAERLGKAALGAEVGVLLCDVGDAASLAAAARQTRLVLNCVGPSRFFGEPVVEACVENGASCIDVSGEPRFLEGMYLQYDGTAAEKGVYVIGSCGFDSIPADLGVLYTRDKLKGTLTAVESFLTVQSGPEGSCVHDGTWKSAVYGLADQDNLRKLRKRIGCAPVPVVGAKLKRRYKKQDLCFTIRN
ncbi:saccharopine dehydrogenase-like oxidoreductase [Sarcoramphus papa]